MSPRSESPKSWLKESDEKSRQSASYESGAYLSNRANRSSAQTMKGLLSRKQNLVPPTVSLPILVIIDMFSVSLVVPLLFQYYKSAGVTSASQRELLSSLFSASQIVGGLMMGALVDSRILRRRTVLLISFAGSALSYALILYGEFWAIVCSRLLIGLVKQTMTVTTTMIAQHTKKEERARQIGRLRASSTVAWIVGPSVGAFLYKNVDKRAPPALACGLFILNLLLGCAILAKDEDGRSGEGQATTEGSSGKKLSKFFTNLQSCFSSKAVGSLIVSFLIFTWLLRATSYANMASYYEQFYGLEPHQRGYLASYQKALSFVVQSLLIGHFLKFIGGERRATVFSAMILAVATWMELQATLPLYLAVIAPIISVSVSMMDLSLHSLMTHVVPKDSLASVFAAVDVLQNAASVTVPFYRTFLFSLMGGSHEASMIGDPNPRSWIISSGFHWCFATVAMSYLLLSPSRQSKKEGEKKAN